MTSKGVLGYIECVGLPPLLGHETPGSVVVTVFAPCPNDSLGRIGGLGPQRIRWDFPHFYSEKRPMDP